MGYSQNEAAFYYAEQERLKKADDARKAAGKGSDFGDWVSLLLLIGIGGLIGGAIHIYNYLVLQVSGLFNAVLSYIPFL